MAKISRRSLLLGASAGSALLLTLQSSHAAGSRFLAVRIWPAQSYTRITLESDSKVRYKYFTLTNPHRLVIDVENTDFNSVLSNISQKVKGNDPYVANIRAGQKDSNTVRIVFDLKQAVQPQVFALAPVSQFNHRLVADLYPADSDPIQAFWQSRQQNQQQAAKTAQPPKDTAAKNPPAAGGKKTRRPIVMLDPGHGGEDPGATGTGGLHEKDAVLAIARYAKKRLEGMGFQVKMTRNEDVFIPLQGRTSMAQRARADVFVSIHANSTNHNTKPRGAEVYILSKESPSNEAIRLLEEKENSADNIGGVRMSGNKDINNVLLDMVQSQTIADSARLGKLVLAQIGRQTVLHKRHVDKAGFKVLRSPEIPSILVETAFLSNPQDEALLGNAAFQRKIGHAIADGVKQYLSAAVLSRS